MSEQAEVAVERVQLGVRMEKRMVQVLKGLAELREITLGQLLEEIVLHSFEPVPGHEGQMAASALGKKSLEALEGLKRVYGMDYDAHSAYGFREKAEPDKAEANEVEAKA